MAMIKCWVSSDPYEFTVIRIVPENRELWPAEELTFLPVNLVADYEAAREKVVALRKAILSYVK